MRARRYSRRAFLGTLAAVAVSGCAGSSGRMFNSYLGKTPPTLQGQFTTWLNGEPTDWPELKGKVVFITFSFLQ